MDLLKAATNSDVLKLIEENQHLDAGRFVLQFAGQFDYPPQILGTLFQCYQKARLKFPKIHRPGMAYTQKALEQSTGEAMLNFKSRRYSGAKAADLTGGLGMDSYAFSWNVQHVDYVELDEIPYQIARHNHDLLSAGNITHHHQSAEGFLKNCADDFDFIYLDPSRRDETKRLFLLKDTMPDVTQLWQALNQNAKKVIVKISPIYDLQRLKEELISLTNILVISVHGEVKEILAERDNQNPGAFTISAVLLDKNGVLAHEIISETEHREINTNREFAFLCEPDAAIIKAGVSADVAEQFGLTFLNHQTDYLTGSKNQQNFPGKVYQVSEILEYKPKKLKRYFSEHGLQKVRIHKRDFPSTPEQLYKKLGLQMGNDGDVIFTKNSAGDLICIIAKVIPQ